MSTDVLLLAPLLLLCAIAAYTDLRSMKIPNLLCLAGLALFLLISPALGWETVSNRLFVSAPVFVACFLLFSVGLIGGGDAKFFPVMLLFVPPNMLPGFLLSLSTGLAIALVLIWLARRLPGSEESRWQGLRERARFPMGVAFLFAAVLFPVVSAQVQAVA